ncbi:hypothetical protein CO051_03800 [Candidatus Roizmanbacteria bacterium CG_4_9_14_0_2_um_filter_39_13]|uniref:Uncharacterized protein n=1 Tax=Candidatus Roizmanbacteria bacterium CG_4_9_14_0_2_um_filter_39_13 TaxID=1974839 RepID=A0A2M8EYU2_9BACT|nr:MAG: hypothetical protein COY15_02425 [Candidatus Roizmanbacteria bacterium CG_4_10_14_0_2_um_filter_39_12]PJC31779.1 MAG: hypothetical protein CO051_03800 [Candidatus Roizmanbacteria bacterium CG_4_9_14_0_2_um_filter_39_13]
MDPRSGSGMTLLRQGYGRAQHDGFFASLRMTTKDPALSQRRGKQYHLTISISEASGNAKRMILLVIQTGNKNTFA